MIKIKKWTIFFFYMIMVFILSGILIFLIYIEDEVDPNIIPLSHDGIVYVFSAVIIIGTLFFTGYMFSDVISSFKNSGKNDKILKEGRLARAKIIKLNENDESVVTVNDQPFVSLTLEIYDGNKKPYQVDLKTIISRLYVPQFQEGKYLKVRISPNDPNEVVIDQTSFSINPSKNSIASSNNSQTKNKKAKKLFYIWFILPILGILVALENYYPEAIPFNKDVYGSIIAIFAITALITSMFSSFKGLFKHLFLGKDDKRILKTGKPALATILNIKESAEGIVTINGQPLVALEMEVDDGAEKYKTELETIIRRLDLPKFQPGKKFCVKIDPNNKLKIVFDSSKEILKKIKIKK